MKVAICLSGQTRNSELCYPFISDNIVKCNSDHDFDFFIHTWEGSDGSSSWESSIDIDKESIIDIYNPRLYDIEKQKLFNNDIGDYKTILGDISMIKRVKSMFYSILRCNELKCKYEKDNNFKYDCVIRLRFDFQIQSPLLLDMDLNKISIKDEKSHDEYSVNDHIAISNSDNMDIYSNVYNDFGDIYNKEKCHFNPEMILGRHLKINKFDINKVKIDSIIRRFKSFEKNEEYWSPHR
tara:strand:+ start:456 stop:1169 length:714 start_codon:yes stop_codon:yes gene_type:complete